MTAAGTRFAKREGRAVLAALCSALLASCTSTTDPNLDFSAPGFNAPATAQAQAADAVAEGTTAVEINAPQIAENAMPAGAEATAVAAALPATVMDENDKELPVVVAYLPTAKPATGTISLQQAVEAEAEAERLAAAAAAAQAAEQAAAQASVPLAKPAEPQTDIAAAPVQPEAEPEQVAAAVETPAETIAVEPAKAPPPKKGFFASLFGSSSARSPAAPATSGRGAPSGPVKPLVAAAAPAAKPLIDTAEEQDAKPIIQIASAESGQKPVSLASVTGESALPGVRQTALFEITRKSGIDDDSDVDLHEEEDGGPVQLASAAGMARLAPNGLLRQTENVDVACLKPSLVRVLKAIEQHYGGKIVVTSGYRSPSHNARSRGAKNSLHMYCAAADIQITGVSKWELANYVRSMPGRGGVGTYCHTDSVHVDVGPERDWNWRCSRRK
ncbi:YcbK family protein [Mesorhizobium sp. KR1-2]|uniref:YcbK family protein n=1 Tax=Mesorhizobium sp. KR1-2 TaxID=3156609 RepID=UPI0032B538A1